MSLCQLLKYKLAKRWFSVFCFLRNRPRFLMCTKNSKAVVADYLSCIWYIYWTVAVISLVNQLDSIWKLVMIS